MTELSNQKADERKIRIRTRSEPVGFDLTLQGGLPKPLKRRLKNLS